MARVLKLLVLAAALLVVAGAVVVRGITSRTRAAAIVRQETLDQSIFTVAVTRPKLGAMKDELSLPANIQPFTDSPIYARTSGYLRKWYADIGAHVKSGQLLAEIDTPEVDQQLAQARADLATSEANEKLSEITATRYQALLKLDAISRQETDQAVSDLEAKKATVTSNQANVKRLQELVSFEKVYAPFDGVITARNTDIGALVNAGNGGAAQELFHMAAVEKLRVFVSVPQMYSQAAIPGVAADLTLSEFPGQRFRGKLVRSSESINAATRTLLAEVDIDNPSGKLLPGAFAEVHLKLNAQAPALVLPVTALIFRAQGMQVAVIRPGEHGDQAELVPVTLGRDFGTEIEITSGVTANDRVIVGPPDSLVAGQQVRVEPAGGEK